MVFLADSSAHGLPIVFFAGGRNDVAGDLTGSRQRTYPVLRSPGRMRRNDLSHRLAETRHQNCFPGFADSLEYGQAGRPEFGNGNFFHVGAFFEDRTTIRDRGQCTKCLSSGPHRSRAGAPAPHKADSSQNGCDAPHIQLTWNALL